MGKLVRYMVQEVVYPDDRAFPLDLIDIVNDKVSGGDYKREEDPRLFTSQKTGRGPLAEDWIQRPPNGTIMCAYKLIKVRGQTGLRWSWHHHFLSILLG